MRILSFVVFALLLGCDPSAQPVSPQSSGESPTPIRLIQGDGNVSPLVGQTVNIEAVVSGDFQGDNNATGDLGGFYVQQSDADSPLGAAGVFVYQGNRRMTAVATGDRVRVTGKVQEHFGETQVLADSIAVIGRGELRPVPLSLPVDGVTSNDDGLRIAALEPYEGLLVEVSETVTVTDLFELEAFGSMTVAAGGVPLQFTSFNDPDKAGFDNYRNTVAASRLILDDGQRRAYLQPPRYLAASLESNFSIRVGDTASDIVGNLRFSRGSGGRGVQAYRLMPTEPVLFASNNPRTTAPGRSGNLRVASFNVENLFSQPDDGRERCGPLASDSCRGADSARELQRQLAKIVTVIVQMDADIVGLAELENNDGKSLEMLVDAINARLREDRYASVRTGTVGTDSIVTAFIYRPDSIALKGDPIALTSALMPSYNDAKNRPALLQTFVHRDSATVLNLTVNHFKSKGSDCDELGDPNRNDGQGNCNGTRTAAAAALADWLRTDPTRSGSDNILILGDLNAYPMEDPLRVLRDQGFINLLEGQADGGMYSLLFRGQRGALDHALASPPLAANVTAAVEWHINADEPNLFDYNLENDRDPNLFDSDIPFASSDHDPLIVDLALTN